MLIKLLKITFFTKSYINCTSVYSYIYIYLLLCISTVQIRAPILGLKKKNNVCVCKIIIWRIFCIRIILFEYHHDKSTRGRENGGVFNYCTRMMIARLIAVKRNYINGIYLLHGFRRGNFFFFFSFRHFFFNQGNFISKFRIFILTPS